MRKCLVPNGSGQSCQREVNHEGGHYAKVGAGASAWPGEFPRWDHKRGWVRPGTPEYEESLEEFRDLVERCDAAQRRGAEIWAKRVREAAA